MILQTKIKLKQKETISFNHGLQCDEFRVHHEGPILHEKTMNRVVEARGTTSVLKMSDKKCYQLPRGLKNVTLRARERVPFSSVCLLVCSCESHSSANMVDGLVSVYSIRRAFIVVTRSRGIRGLVASVSLCTLFRHIKILLLHEFYR